MKRYCCENFEQAVNQGKIRKSLVTEDKRFYVDKVYFILYHCPFCGTDLREQKKPATLNRYYDIEEVA